MDLKLIMNDSLQANNKSADPAKNADEFNLRKNIDILKSQTICHHPTPVASPTSESTIRMPSQEPLPQLPQAHTPQLQPCHAHSRGQQLKNTLEDCHCGFQYHHQSSKVALSPPTQHGNSLSPLLPTHHMHQPTTQADFKIPVISTIEVKGVVIDKTTRRFVCQVCKKEFIRKSGLVRHNLIHLGVRPNQCQVCGKKFLQKSALTVHHRIHSGEKPYACRHCGRRFGDSSSLCRHYRMHMAKGEGGKPIA